MQYEVVEQRVGADRVATNTCYLVRNSWDDFGFKTTFEVVLFDENAKRYDLGSVRIMQYGMSAGYVALPPSPFNALGDRYCSLGSSREYYIATSALPVTLRRRHLTALQDCVDNLTIFESFRDQEAMRSSLLRDVAARDVTHRYPRNLRGDASLTPYRFWYNFSPAIGAPGAERCQFEVRPESRPPTNVHILIGRNGVGKTRLLAGMADALMNNQAASIGIPGQFEFDTQESGPGEFLNLVIVSFSAFDRFDPIPSGQARTDTTLPYYYVGIKAEAEAAQSGRVRIKSPEELDTEFGQSLKNVAADPQRLDRWLDAMRIVSSDPGIGDIGIETMFLSGDAGASDRMLAAFSLMSSGHKIVLLTLTRLVETISDRSLVLVDEPETHLHPPLLGSFVRAVSKLLVSRNAVAIVATHSPVVLQEVPASCVSMLMRSGSSMRVIRPDDETFAENVSVLTRKVFGLELEQSGFYKLLRESAFDMTYDQVLNRFDGQIGSEGRALTRAFVSGEE